MQPHGNHSLKHIRSTNRRAGDVTTPSAIIANKSVADADAEALEFIGDIMEEPTNTTNDTNTARPSNKPKELSIRSSTQLLDTIKQDPSILDASKPDDEKKKAVKKFSNELRGTFIVIVLLFSILTIIRLLHIITYIPALYGSDNDFWLNTTI